jgi:hypothetical protein
MKKFREQMQQQLELMQATGKLFRSAVPGSVIWDLYLSSFDNDPIFRDPESTMHNCNLCNNFIRRYGNIVAIDEDMNIMTLWDFVPEDKEFIFVCATLSLHLLASPIEDVFFETYEELNGLPYESLKRNQDVYRLGIHENVKRYTKEEAELYPGVVKPNEVRKFEHISLMLDKAFVKHNEGSIEAIQGKYRDAKNVFKRALDEIPFDTLELVRDLINQGSLVNGPTYLDTITKMMEFKKVYDNDVHAVRKDTWAWVFSYENPIAKFKNTLIGVLCSELAEGMELNKACKNWNFREDPTNKHKPKAPITQRQIEEAQVFVDEHGYTGSFRRRPATIDDIKANEILHLNSEGAEEIKSVHLFDAVKPTIPTRHKRSEFDKVEEVTIEKFMSDILPGCTSVEAFLANNHENHMVTLTTAEDKNSKQIFKWNNNFSWTFNGNLAGKSEIKKAVKLAGGHVDGILNFRLAWNGGDGRDNSDLDAWALEPSGRKIGFDTSYRKGRGINGNDRSPNSGQLDVDNTNPGGRLAVENITWIDSSKMTDGIYKLWVNQFSARNSQGFEAEIEVDGETYNYRYDKPVSGNVQVAEVHLKDGKFTVVHKLPETNSTKEVYGLQTNNFHKVNLVCLSPNHWDGQAVGNKHYFFMLDGAQSPAPIRSFHNENLKSDLLTYRKVMEVLGNSTMVESKTKELSGLGFNASVKDELILRLKGSHKRVIKVKF